MYLSVLVKLQSDANVELNLQFHIYAHLSTTKVASQSIYKCVQSGMQVR